MRTIGLAALTMIVCVFLPGDSGRQAANPSESRTQVVILGTGTPNAEPDRSGAAIAIVVDEIPYLVDCGPGLVRRASAAFRKGVKGLEPRRLNRVFITHLHSDHTLGYPDLIFTPWTLERSDPLESYGPRGLRAMTTHILEAYGEDINARIHGLEPANETGYKVKAHEIEAGIVYRDSLVTVKAFAVRHGSWEQAFGFRFETPDRTIVVSGDTVPVQSIIENCAGCDVLVHEVYSQAGFLTRPPDWRKYHADSHTSTKELAEIAAKARPGLLVLYHQLLWGSTDEDLVREVRETYKGRVVSARDLDIF